jgi:glycosyltransferase involved in cell wall biosynthesis
MRPIASGATSDRAHNGAAPEIVEHGVDGFLVQDEHEMARVVEQAAGIDPMRCRQTAAERFAPDQVAVGYEAVYRQAVAAGVVAPSGRVHLPAA